VIVGLAIYDKLYGMDEKFGVMLGEVYRRDYMKFVKEYVVNPNTGMLRRTYHRIGDVAEKFDGAYATAFTAMMVRHWEPEWTNERYQAIRNLYLKELDFDLGAYVVESLPETAEGTLVDTDVDEPGMLGEGAMAIFLVQAAAREFGDAETFDRINKTLSTVMRPKWSESEIRCDLGWFTEDTGIPGFSMGRMYNMFMGWALWAKVHVGWEAILNYDWSKNRDKDGRMLDYGSVQSSRPTSTK